jgi:hypothetical protein
MTSFSVGLLISQLATVTDTPWFPPLIAALIALSTVYLGLENIVQAARPHGAGERRHGDDLNWMLAFGFGLLHGYAYAIALREMLQYAGEHLLTALMAFNAGVGIAQIALMVVLVPALGLMPRWAVADWLGIIILSAFATATAWDWMLERGKQLAKFPMPSLDATFPAAATTAVLAALMLTGGVWLASGWLSRWIKPDRMPPASDLAAHAQASGAESD